MQDELPPERFWFELGYGAAWADAFMANDQKPAWQMTDAAVDRAWDILPECYDGDAGDLERNAWNTRTPDPALAAAQADVARLREALNECDRARVMIGARLDSMNEVQKEGAINEAWHVLQRAIVKADIRAALESPKP